MKTHGQKEISESLQEFVAYIEQCRNDYAQAHDAVGREDKRLQDLLHELEFAEDRDARNKVATKSQRSRKGRRKHKDDVMRLQLVVDFFDEPQHRKMLNNLRQLIGKQRSQEAYLDGKREYKPRVKD